MPGSNATGKIYWGWFVVAGAFLRMALAYGARYSFGLFVQQGPLLPIIAADRFGRQRMGAIYGLLAFFVGGSAGPWGRSSGGSSTTPRAPTSPPGG